MDEAFTEAAIKVLEALEPGEIVQRDRDRRTGDAHRTSILPVPVGSLGPEHRIDRLAVDEYLKLAGRAGNAPGR